MKKYSIFWDKIYRKLHWYFFDVCKLGKNKWIYPCYWHYKINSRRNQNVEREEECPQLYLTQQPNRGAGIGHQLANWNAGYWFSQKFNVAYAYLPFSSGNWDYHLGFGEGETAAYELQRQQGYRKRRLPYYDENSEADMQMIRDIIASYRGSKIIFYNELDQSYYAQCGMAEVMREKFNHAIARNNENFIWNTKELNIAIHIRRGDIVVGQTTGEASLMKRWLDDAYYIKVLEQVLPIFFNRGKVQIYLFSQGEREDFREFERYENIKFCLDMSPYETFSHLVRADVLIASKSSFSYKPALMSDGIKICPRNFWHDYPEGDDWILAEDNGDITTRQLEYLRKLDRRSK